MGKISFKVAGVTIRPARLRVKEHGKMKLYTIEEYGEHLRLHGGEHAKWGDAILELASEGERLEQLEESIGDVVGQRCEADDVAGAVGELAADSDELVAVRDALCEHAPNAPGETPADKVEWLANQLADIRVVLVERGALAADDGETEIHHLLGALL